MIDVQAMNSNAEEWEPILREMTVNSLRTPLSVIVLTKAGDVAGVLLNSLWRRDDSNEGNHDTSHFSEKVRKFSEFHHQIYFSNADFQLMCSKKVTETSGGWPQKT